MLLHDPTILTFVIIANVLALIMAITCWKRPKWGRILFAINFIGAALFNGVFWFIEPEEYSYYSEFVWLDSYQHFITGPFLEHLRLILGLIISLQLYIGLGLLYKGWWLKSAALLGILFLVAIAPFGLGAAFPMPLIQSVGLWGLFKYAKQTTIQ
jgi:hypothetical protein